MKCYTITFSKNQPLGTMYAIVVMRSCF